MALYDDLFAEIATPLLQQQLGESVDHWPLGEEADEAAVTAIVDLTEEDEDQAKEISSKTGRQIKRRGRLEVPSSLTLDDRDLWLVRGELWRTLRIRGRHADLATVEIQRAEKHSTRLPAAPAAMP